jgi:hypothetical protein
MSLTQSTVVLNVMVVVRKKKDGPVDPMTEHPSLLSSHHDTLDSMLGSLAASSVLIQTSVLSMHSFGYGA